MHAQFRHHMHARHLSLVAIHVSVTGNSDLSERNYCTSLPPSTAVDVARQYVTYKCTRVNHASELLYRHEKNVRTETHQNNFGYGQLDV